MHKPAKTLPGARLAFAIGMSLSLVIASALTAAGEERPAVPARKPVVRQPHRAAVFETDVLPILKRHCLKCHDAKSRKGELDLSSITGVMKGSESGAILTPGKPRDSRMVEVVTDGTMPPEKKDRLSPVETGTIRRWIETGARSRLRTKSPTAPVSHHRVTALLLLRCTVCHGGRRREAGLDLRSVAGMFKGGKSGPAIVPGKPEQSLLLKRIHADQMPPRRMLVSVSVKPMDPPEIQLLESWIRQGAPQTSESPADPSHRLRISGEDRRFWSFQPPKAVSVPRVRGTSLVRNPLDAFLLQKLEAKGLTFSRAAGRATLLRRVTFDLTGLPPSPDDVLRFLADGDPLAYEKRVDRLLAAPRYGERWGRHWLDVAGYADSEGAQNEDRPRPHMWRYRDYVVRAFNADKPYDRFLREQLAGDELADYEAAPAITPEIYDNLVATGFLRTAPDRTFANITNFVPDRLEVIADEMQIVGSAVLGLTVHCARCHSHKFDPVSQADYYRLKAIFQDAYDEHDWLKSQGPRTLPFVTTPERTAWQTKIDRINAAIKRLQGQLADAEKAARKRSAVGAKQKIAYAELRKHDAAYRTSAERIEAQIKNLKTTRPSEPRIRALWSRGTPSPTFLLRRGNYLTPGPVVPPDVPAVLRDAHRPFVIRPPWTGAKPTGRRLAFASWATHRRHPLTARVMVNRLWAHHFGRALVTTPDNFGKAGARPSHPELLDWLAVEFVRHGWSVKRLHRLIVTSTAYRQRSDPLRKAFESRPNGQDPDNILLSRFPLRRLEAEALSDSLLSAAGELDETPFGPPVPVSRRSDGLVTSNRAARGWRRSIYVQHRRTTIPTLLDNFDSPQMGPNCVQRGVSIVAPQALNLLNGEFVHTLARNFAGRVVREAGDDVTAQLRRISLIAYGRLPSKAELTDGSAALAELAARWEQSHGAPKTGMTAQQRQAQSRRRALENFCHAVMNSAEFLFVD